MGSKLKRKPFTDEELAHMRKCALTWDGAEVDDWDRAEQKGFAEVKLRLLDMLDAAEARPAVLIEALTVDDIRGCIGAPGRIPDHEIEQVRKFLARSIAPGGIAHVRIKERAGEK